MSNGQPAGAINDAHSPATRTTTLVGMALLLAWAATRWIAMPAGVTESDEVLFCFAIDKYDLSHHHPHPPGYPLYVGLGKLVAAFGVRNFTALAWIGLVASCSAVWPLYRLAIELAGASRPLAWAACGLYGLCPVVWLNSARALSDVPGAAIALWVAWMLWVVVLRRDGMMERLSNAGDAAIAAARDRPTLALRFWVVAKRHYLAPGRGTYVLAAAVAAAGIGVRPQLAVVFIPLLIFVAVMARLGLRVTFFAAILAAIVCAAWFVPMVEVSGGWSSFREVMGAQSEWYLRYDTAFEEPAATWRDRVVYWRNIWGAAATCWPLLLLVVAGLVRLCVKRRRAAAFLLVWLVPYGLFVFIAHSPATPRYALPAVAPLALLAAAALGGWPRVAAIVTGVLAIGLGAQAAGLVWKFHEEPIPPLQAASWVAAHADPGDAFVLDAGLEVVVARHEAHLPWKIDRAPQDEAPVPGAATTWLLTAHSRTGREPAFALSWKARRYHLFTRERFQTAYAYRLNAEPAGN